MLAQSVHKVLLIAATLTVLGGVRVEPEKAMRMVVALGAPEAFRAMGTPKKVELLQVESAEERERKRPEPQFAD